jgi:hypothetical protein
MDRTPLNLLAGFRDTQKRALLFARFIVVLMMACLALAFVQLGERIFQTWSGNYLILAAILISVEAMATRTQSESMEFRESLLFHLSEWVALAILLKLMIYLAHGPAQMITDLRLWQENFLPSFFTLEYILALMILLAIWFLSRSFSAELSDLYRTDGVTDEEDLGKLQNIIHEIRERLASRIFVIGAMVTILSVMARLATPFLPALLDSKSLGYAAPVIVVSIYFFLAFILLSQSQFALLHTRWFWQNLPVSPEITQNWIKYGVIFFLVLAVVAFILPTQYSIGLFETLGYAIEFLTRFFSFLMVLITLPFTFLLSLFSVVNGNPQPPPLPAAPTPFQPAAPGQPAPWLEFLRSLAFWIIFIGVIVLAIRFYLKENSALWESITKVPLFHWVAGIWSRFLQWIKGANHQVAEIIRREIHRVHSARQPLPGQTLLQRFGSGRMTPRKRVIYFYLSLLDLAGQQGLARRPSQTPSQYEQRLADALPENQENIKGLTDAFIEARYSQHPVEESQSRQAGNLFDQIRAALSRARQKDR